MHLQLTPPPRYAGDGVGVARRGWASAMADLDGSDYLTCTQDEGRPGHHKLAVANRDD